jgi:hypothetical protein
MEGFGRNAVRFCRVWIGGGVAVAFCVLNWLKNMLAASVALDPQTWWTICMCSIHLSSL